MHTCQKTRYHRRRYIGLEFAAMYANYGSWSLFWNTAIPSSREDRDIANVIQTRLKSWAFALSLMHRSQ
ncbi:MAG: hypothetical protein ACLRXQ_13050 [Phascolarctobacterium faecium]